MFEATAGLETVRVSVVAVVVVVVPAGADLDLCTGTVRFNATSSSLTSNKAWPVTGASSSSSSSSSSSTVNLFKKLCFDSGVFQDIE